MTQRAIILTFVLGITAARYPDLVRAIAGRGHDLACHGYDHRRVPTQSQDEFKADVERCADAMFARDRASQALGMRIVSIAPGLAALTMTVRADRGSSPTIGSSTMKMRGECNSDAVIMIFCFMPWE